MLNETIKTRRHTTEDGTLNLTVNVGVADADVAVTVQVRTLTAADKIDANAWPIDFFEQVGDIDDLVAKLDLLYTQPHLRARHSQAGLDFARTLDWDEIVKSWDRFLTKVASS